jgi:hypothetical protein
MSDLRLTPFYHSAVNAVTKPNRLTHTSQYFIDRWMPLLGGNGTMIVLALRRDGFLNRKTGEIRDEIVISRCDLAAAAGMSEDTLTRELAINKKTGLLQNKWLHEFVKKRNRTHRIASGLTKQEPSAFWISMDDPVHPDDWHLVESAALELGWISEKQPETQDTVRETQSASLVTMRETQSAEPETQSAEPETQSAEPETQSAEPETQSASHLKSLDSSLLKNTNKTGIQQQQNTASPTDTDAPTAAPVKTVPPSETAPPTREEASPVVDANFDESINLLRAEGIGFNCATSLAQKHSLEQIKRQIALLPTRGVTTSASGMLIRAIEQDWPSDRVPIRRVMSGKSSSRSPAERLKIEAARLPAVPEADLTAAKLRFAVLPENVRSQLNADSRAGFKSQYPEISGYPTASAFRQKAMTLVMYQVVTEYERRNAAAASALASVDALDAPEADEEGAGDQQAARDVVEAYLARSVPDIDSFVDEDDDPFADDE